MQSPLNLNPKEISSLIAKHYGLKPNSINFLPKGEDSVLYQIKDASNKEYLLKFFNVRRKQAKFKVLRSRLELTLFLRERLNFSFVVAPILSKTDQLLIGWQTKLVALFPLIKGKLMATHGLALNQLRQVAQAVAGLHQLQDFNGFSLKDNFKPGFADSLERFLLNLKPVAAKTDVKQKMIKLLISWKTRLLSSIHQWRKLYPQLILNHLILTHGDLSPGNLIFDTNDNLKILDWDGACLSLPEKDINLFTDPKYLVDFIKFYRKQLPQLTLRLHHFAYFKYRWDLEGIWERIDLVFNQSSALKQQQHELRELTHELQGHQYLEANLKLIDKTLTS